VQEHEEWPSVGGGRVKQGIGSFGDLLAVPPGSRSVVVPPGVALIPLEGRLDPPADVVDRGGEVTALTQEIGQQSDRRVELLAPALGDDLMREDVAAAE
jgi:hypothetical protein